MREERAVLSFRNVPNLRTSQDSLVQSTDHEPLWKTGQLCVTIRGGVVGWGRGGGGGFGNFASVSMVEKGEKSELAPSAPQLLSHPLAALAYVPRDVAIFAAGAIAGAAAKTLTAPLDRVKLLMQTHGVRVGQESAKKAIGFVEAVTTIGKEEGIKGYWKGNLPQLIRIIPYSAVQLFAYETYKKLFRGKDGELSVIGRLAAGACAGMTSTFGEKVLARELQGESAVISINSCCFCCFCNTYMLSLGHSKKANANEGYTLQDSLGCFSWNCAA